MLPMQAVTFFWCIACACAAYNETLAKKLLYMSSAAYSSAANQGLCLNTLFNTNYTILEYFEEVCDEAGNKCSGYIVDASVEKNQYFVFTGSRGRTQIAMEVFRGLEPDRDFYGMGQVMSYFMEGHDKLWSHISPYLTDPKYKYYKSIFTGHSLGAALATLAAARCAKIGYCPDAYVDLYTFGEPRTGSVQFAKTLDNMIGESFRVVHRNDIVPQVPACAKTSGLISFFRNSGCTDLLPTNPYHHGTEIWYNNDMQSGAINVQCTEATQPQSCPFAWNWINIIFPDIDSNIEDHIHYFGIDVTEYGKTGCTNNNKTIS